MERQICPISKGLAIIGLILTPTLFLCQNAVAIPITPVFVNELHYDNTSTDVNEAIEIAGPAGTDLSGWNIVLYNGANGLTYDTNTLSGIIPNQQSGFGTLTFNYPSNGIQNGAPDGIALVDNLNNVVQFLSYEGDFTAVDGIASGLISTNIGVTEGSSTPIGYSLQLSGTGTFYENFHWMDYPIPNPNTFGDINTNQTFGTDGTDVFVNELHYDNASTDTNEAIEIAGPAGTDLTGWDIVLYNGANGLAYDTNTLSGIIPDQQSGFGTLTFNYPTNGIQNGAPDGIALVDNLNNVIQFLSYEGSFTALDGIANGILSTDIGVAEDFTTPSDFSLQLWGVGSIYENFSWKDYQNPAQNTFGGINSLQTFYQQSTTVPEPTTLVLMVLGLIGLAFRKRKNPTTLFSHPVFLFICDTTLA